MACVASASMSSCEGIWGHQSHLHLCRSIADLDVRTVAVSVFEASGVANKSVPIGSISSSLIRATFIMIPLWLLYCTVQKEIRSSLRARMSTRASIFKAPTSKSLRTSLRKHWSWYPRSCTNRYKGICQYCTRW